MSARLVLAALGSSLLAMLLAVALCARLVEIPMERSAALFVAMSAVYAAGFARRAARTGN